MLDVRQIRKNQGLSQRKFAEKYGMSVRAVQSWEQGVQATPASVLVMLNRIEQLESELSHMPKDMMRARLVDRFGWDDVVENYVSDKYPMGCDFYIKSKDLYIELFGHWTHGGTWYEPDDTGCQYELASWEKAARTNDTYKIAMSTWAGNDVKKRVTAMENDLNYIVFWHEDLGDFYEWLNSGCPNGRDYLEVFSWKKNVKSYPKHVSECQELTAPDGFDFTGDGMPDTGLATLDEVLNSENQFESNSEPLVTAELIKKFGAEDVDREYKCPEYPFEHIYIRSKDLHVEILNEPAHGGHWFREDNPEDLRTVRQMVKLEGMTEPEGVISYEWSVTDLLRRWYAGHNRLNYVVFWKPNLSDFHEWMQRNCPDGHDWYVENSWKK